jgi:A/G-specific adenine glycosylase
LTPFAARVVGWQRVHGRRDLPWQNGDAYRVWLSEVMLQQTQVSTVLPYYARFVTAFPTVDDLARAPLDRVLALWSGLGYYRRAHHLHATARTVVAHHGGCFPTDAATLATLPGIGRSTANAIAAFAGDGQAPILDGNVRRVLARHRGVEGWPGAPHVESKLWDVAEDLVAPVRRDEMASYTQGMMDIGATICMRANPRCAACPVADDCVARHEGRVNELPAPRPRKVLPQRETAVLLLRRDGRVLLEQRPPFGLWAGLWTFPEFDRAADLVDRVARRFRATIVDVRALPPLTHTFTHFALTMHPVEAVASTWPAEASERSVAWFERDDAIVAAVPSPVRKLLRTYC